MSTEERTAAGLGLRIVITGASSGIGRAAAVAFARRGSQLALAARREDALRDVATECETLGAKVVIVPTDVTDASAVLALAQAADTAFGGIDVWINNAGSGVVAPFQDADIVFHRKTVEVNLIGAMNGAWAVLPIFLRQDRGLLINNVSMGGWAPAPFAAAYTASKFGLRGFTASLRQELGGRPDIHVCGVFPAMIDTPGFAHAANLSGHRVAPGPFLYTPEDVARTFVALVRRPRDEVAVGWPARMGQLSYSLARAPTERLTSLVGRWLLARARPAPRDPGGLLAPIPEGRAARGGWLARQHLPSAGKLSLAIAAIGMAAGLAAGISAARRPGRG